MSTGPTETRTGLRPWHVLAVAGGIAPLAALLAPLGMAPLATLVLVLLLPSVWRRRAWKRIPRGLALALTAPVLWALLSLTWSIEPWQGLKTGAGLTMELVGALLLATIAADLEPGERRAVGLALGVGVSIALSLLLFEIHVGGLMRYLLRIQHQAPDQIRYLTLSRLSRGQTVTTLLTLPAMVLAWRNGWRVWAAAMGLGTLLDALGGHPLALKVGLALALAVGLGILWRGRILASAMWGTFAVIILATPLLSLLPSPQQTMDATETWLPRSAHHRLTIWTFGAQRALQKPLFGWGLDSSRSIPGGDDEILVKVVSPRYGNYVLTEAQMPLHPHNSAVQIWLELGGVGAILAIVALGAMAARIAARSGQDPLGAAAMASLLVIVSTVCLVSYGLWQSWWLCSIALSSTMLAAGLKSESEDQPQ